MEVTYRSYYTKTVVSIMNRIIRTPLFWIIVVSVLPVLHLVMPGLPITHDGQDHVARIANFYAALRDGIIVPRWAANLNWGYGHPILMFLYPLPEYLASLFHFMGFTLVDSTKIMFGLSFVASAVTMFLWMNAGWGRKAGITGALLYTFAPYRFVDLTIRGALGEHVAFIFPPLVLYFLLKNRWVGVSLSLAALILSHNAISIMFMPIIVLYFLYLLVFESKNRMSFTIHSLLFILLGFGASVYFWGPALLEGKFTLRDIVISGQSLKRFVPWTWFIYSPWRYGLDDQLTKFLGFGQWVGIIASVLLIFNKVRGKLRVLLISLLILLFISLCIMTQMSIPIWRITKILQDFQFPWRFLSVSVFLSATLGGISVHIVMKKYGRKKLTNSLVFTYYVFIVVLTFWMWFPKGYQILDESFYTGVYSGTTDTGESSPIWSVRFMEHRPDRAMDVIDGDASVSEDIRRTTVHEYTITAHKPTLMMENTLYFPGWMIYVNGKPTEIEWQNPDYRGLMTFRIPTGIQHVRVAFEDTKVRILANMMSVGSFTVLLGIIIWQTKKRFQ